MGSLYNTNASSSLLIGESSPFILNRSTNKPNFIPLSGCMTCICFTSFSCPSFSTCPSKTSSHPPPLQEAFPNTSNQMWSLPPNPYLYTHFSCWLPGPCLGLSHHDLLFTLPGREDLCPGKKEGPSCRQQGAGVMES